MNKTATRHPRGGFLQFIFKYVHENLRVINLLPIFAKKNYNDAYNFHHIWIQIPVLLQ